ncbi:MAG: hypothetical protein ACRCXT_17425 [Paraclostridium sp.]
MKNNELQQNVKSKVLIMKLLAEKINECETSNNTEVNTYVEEFNKYYSKLSVEDMKTILLDNYKLYDIVDKYNLYKPWKKISTTLADMVKDEADKIVNGESSFSFAKK